MIRSTFSRWMKHISSPLKNSRSRRRSQPRLAVEIGTLEPRTLLAGVANVTFASGTLTITGVDDFSQLGVMGAANNQEIRLVGIAPGKVSVFGQNETTVNGAGTFVGVTNIKLDLKEGSDLLEVSGTLTLTGGLTFLGGNGNNRIEFVSASTASLGSLTITNLEGDDEIRLLGSQSISGALTINNGDGVTDTTIEDSTVGSLKITNGDGRDELVLRRVNVNGTTQINNGTGSTLTDWSDNSSLLGAITVVNGDGDDNSNITKLNLISAKGVTITNGDGPTQVELRGNYTGNVSVANASGYDALVVDGVTVTGNLSIKNNAGGSTTTLGRTNVISGNASFTSLSGVDDILTDTFNQLVGLVIQGTTTISTGNDGGSIILQPTTNLVLNGNLSITDGDGDFEVQLGKMGANQSFKGVTINYGAGNSDTQFFGTIETDALAISGNSGSPDVTLNGATTTKGLTLDFKGSNQGLDFTANANLIINGNLKITTANGDDDVRIDNGLTVTGTTTVVMGSGNDLFSATATSTFTGNASITTGAGSDSVRLEKATFLGNLTIDTGSAADLVDVRGCTIKGTTSILLGSGADRLFIQATATNAKTTFEKAVTINAGSGDDILSLGVPSDTNDFVEFLSSLTINAGSGLDKANFKNLAGGGTRSNVFAVNPVLTGLEAVQ